MDMKSKNTETTTAPRFWLSLDQAENPEKFALEAGGEFSSTPVREGYEREGLDRRDFMKIMGASAMMASLAGCTRRPVQKIVPYVSKPEEITVGVPNYYASACPQTGHGLLVTTREGRPIKVDGNADHPINIGAISARGQASVHDLYDPDRLRAPMMNGTEAKWSDVDALVRAAFGRGGVAILSGTVLSPTLERMIDKSGARHVMVDAHPMDDVLDGQAQSFGTRIFPRYRFDRADFILSIDADFLDTWGSHVEYTKQFADRRRLEGSRMSMSKLVAFESAPRLTGQNADLRIAIHPSDQLFVALALANEVARATGRGNSELDDFDLNTVSRRTGVPVEKLKEVSRDLLRFRGRSIVIAGGLGGKGPQALALQNVVNFINSALGNDGETIDGTATPSYQYKGSYDGLERLVNSMRAGAIKTLVIQGINPLYHFPKNLGFEEALSKVENVVYVGSYLDETAIKAKVVAAESHGLESWGDVNPAKGVYSIVQPTIRPLWDTRSFLEMLMAWTGVSGNAHDLVRSTWRELHGRYGAGRSFDSFWDDCLQLGVIEPASKRSQGSSSARSYRGDALRSAVAALRGVPGKGGEGEFTLVLVESIAMGDGFSANNAILQELPDPVSKNTWGNYLAVAPETAKKNGWTDGDIVTVQNSAHQVTLPLYRQPGLHPGVVMSSLGYGRKFNGRIGNDVGVSFVNFTTSTQSSHPVYAVNGVKITKTGKKEKIPCTQGHHSLEGRDILFDTTLDEYRENPKSGIVRHFPNPPSIWNGFEYKGYKWGMVIDVNNCTGCSACVVACSVENNVPAVGKDQVQKGREMQWIRIDRYYSGDTENPDVIYQPMLCQHCDNAPCETVCPVLATTHSSEGLNQMTYNRCVGTKYCSNNCPYKVRRFNWFNNNGDMNGTLEHPIPLSKNPEVTLRSRGVMEKCTFCVQRIEAGKSRAKSEGRRVVDSDIRTACQEACPADAITFGDVNNPESKVTGLSKHPRGFTSLEEINARPAVTYLTKVRNRAPKLKANSHGEGHS